MKTSYFVKYSFVSGETNVPCRILIQGKENQTQEQAVHDYFKAMWGEKTECDGMAHRYNEYTMLEAVEIYRVMEVPEEDVAVLEKYMGYN